MMHEKINGRAAARAAIAGSAMIAGKPLPKPAAQPRRSRKPKPAPAAPPIDATPERVAKALDGDMRHDDIIDAEIDKAGERPGLTRRFRDSHIDRLRKRGVLSYAQWFAADWLRQIHEQAICAPRVTSSYGEGCGGGGEADYGMPRSLGQAIARDLLRDARAVLKDGMPGLLERAVIHDQMPSFANGRVRDRFCRALANALQPLAVHINAPGT